MDTYAMALMRKQEYKQAELIMLKAIQAVQRAGEDVSAELEYHLAQALHGQSRNEEAKQRLRTALRRLPEDDRSADTKTWRKKLTTLLEEI